MCVSTFARTCVCMCVGTCEHARACKIEGKRERASERYIYTHTHEHTQKHVSCSQFDVVVFITALKIKVKMPHGPFKK